MGKKEKLKQDKSRLARLADDSITIEAFLARVLGVRDQNLLAGRLSHNDLKALFPFLRRASFDYIIDNASVVYSGEVYLVSDAQGRKVPYFNPHLVLEEADYYGTYEGMPQVQNIPNIDEIELSELSTYDLQQLLHIYQEHNMRGAYRKVHTELVGRKNSHHASSERKGRALKKENKNKRPEHDS